MTLVIDSSALVAALVDAGKLGEWSRKRLSSDSLAAPQLMFVEVQNILRRHGMAGVITVTAATLAHSDLCDLKINYVPHESVSARVWELRKNVTCYDASYVAVAEALNATLVTLDRRLASASGPKCGFDLPPI